MDCVFCKIVEGGIPADKVLETPNLLAFLDIKPINLGHTLLIPKTHYENLFDLPDELLKETVIEMKKLARIVKDTTGAHGINIGMNNLPAAGQLVLHAHFHIIPRFAGDGYEHWKGKNYSTKEISNMAKRLKNLKSKF